MVKRLCRELGLVMTLPLPLPPIFRVFLYETLGDVLQISDPDLVTVGNGSTINEHADLSGHKVIVMFDEMAHTYVRC